MESITSTVEKFTLFKDVLVQEFSLIEAADTLVLYPYFNDEKD